MIPGLSGTVAYLATLVSSSSEGSQAVSMGESSCLGEVGGGTARLVADLAGEERAGLVTVLSVVGGIGGAGGGRGAVWLVAGLAVDVDE